MKFKFYPYLAATVAVGLCAVIRGLLDEPLRSHPTLMAFLPGVTVGAYLGGAAVGTYALFLGMSLGLYFFVQPARSFLVNDVPAATEVTLYVLVGSVITLLCDRLRAASVRARQEQSQRAARIAAEELANQIQDRLGIVLRNAPLLVHACDMDLRYTWVGKSHPKIDAQAMIGKRDTELFDAAAAASLMKLKQAVIDSGQSQRGEVLFNLDGKLQAFDMTAEPLLDADGRMRGCIVVGADITERVRSHMELENRLHHLADTLPHMVWIARPDGFREYFNRRWYDYIGPPKQEAEPDQWAQALHPEDRERARQCWATALATGKPYEIEYRFRRHDNTYRWFLGRASPLRDSDGAIRNWFGTCTDINDARQAQESMALLQAAVESANDAVIITSPELDGPGPVIEYVNPAFTQMTGYTLKEILGKTPRILQGPKTDRTLMARLRRDLETTQSFHGETCNYRKDGSTYIVEWRITPLRDTGGRVAHWVAVQRDISDRVQTERLIQISEGRYRALVQATAQVVWVGDANLRSSAAGAWMEEFTGLRRNPDDPLGWWQEAIHPDDRHLTDSMQHAASQLKTFDVELRICRRDNEYRNITIRAVPTRWPDGSFNEYVGMISDITDRRRAEQTAREYEIRFRKAIVDAPVPVLMYSDDGEVLALSNAFAVATGYSVAEVSSIDRWLEFSFPTAQSQRRERLRSLLLTTADRAEEEQVIRTRGGEERVWRLSTSSPGMLPDGRRYMVAIANDLTDRLRAEQQREALLESERAARMEQERIGRMKDEFLATLSHELRTPLHAILGWAQILMRDTRPRTEQDTRKALETIHRNARLQSQLIDDLLDMSRIISGKIALTIQPIDLNEVLQAAMESIRPAAEAKGVELVEPLHSEPEPVRGDAARLQQVMWNLLSNAVKFTPRGGRVEVTMGQTDSQVQISVRDSGQGISPEFLPFVFDRFRQADGTTSRRFGGLGLGLAIARQLIEMHGGTIRAESEGEGKGATFFVRLPVPSVAQPARAARGERNPSLNPQDCESLKGLRILVVDDETDARMLIKKIIEECQAIPITAANVEAAMDFLHRTTVDLLISDIGMPGTDGYEFIRQVRNLPASQGGRTPALALTAFARAEDRQRSLRAGYQMHLPKPVDSAELISAIAALTQLQKSQTLKP